MLLILMTNGMSAFGLKMIAAWHVPTSTKFPYLAMWYAAGAMTCGLPMLWSGIRMSRKELVIGLFMALLSIGGQVGMATALGVGLAGSVVFPVVAGGSLLVVIVAGRFLFSEQMNVATTIGVVVGFVAVILLSMS